MRVVFTRQIALYIRREDPAAADRFTAHLRSKAREISANPRLYARHPASKSSGVRRRPVGKYLVMYAVEPTRITILDIRHGARDPTVEP